MFQRPVTLAFATAAVALAPAVSATASTTTVRAISSCNKAKFMPANYVLFCGDAGAGLEQVSYRWWTAKTAHGTGTYYFNDCKPNCSAGTPHRQSAEITLYRVENTTKYGPLFTRIEVDTRHAHHVFDLPTTVY
jgi:hypothetical protein